MTEMIEAEPALADRILARNAAPGSGAAELARAIRAAIRVGDPVVLTGCGTSEHAAQGVTEILREAVRASDVRAPGHAARLEPVVAQAFELALDPPASGLVIGVSHEGGTTATNAALTAAKAAGARTAIITVTDRSPGAALADIVVETGELDQGWCHTVGYVARSSPRSRSGPTSRSGPSTRRSARRSRSAPGRRGPRIDRRIGGGPARSVRPILVVASGADRPAGRELSSRSRRAPGSPPRTGTWRRSSTAISRRPTSRRRSS